MLEHSAESAAVRGVRPVPRRWLVFLATWAGCSLLLLWLAFTTSTGFDSPATPYALGALLACTLTFLWATPNPVPAEFAAVPTRRGRLTLLILVVGVPLFLLPMLLQGRVLYALPVLAALALVRLRQPVTRREVYYALGLGLTAGLAGLGIGNVREFSPVMWGALQLPLVFGGLLAGWKIFEASGVSVFRIGASRFLRQGWPAALRGFGLGMLISLPWSLGNVIVGGVQDGWVHAWWQPVLALQPGIAEEAWGRILIVALLLLVFRRAARPRTALMTALILAAYWFAYLHTPMGLNGVLSTLMIGTLYALPISFACLFRDLETAIGFHFFIDFVRFAFALIVL